MFKHIIVSLNFTPRIEFAGLVETIVKFIFDLLFTNLTPSSNGKVYPEHLRMFFLPFIKSFPR